MKVTDMWRGSMAIKMALIVLCLMVISIGNSLLYTIVGGILLAGGCFFAFREGGAMGHAAAGISSEIESIRADPEKAGQLDPSLYKQAWSVSHGVAGIFAGGLIDYCFNALYIATILLKVRQDIAIFPHMASFAVSLPLWSVFSLWHDTFTGLSPDMVLLLLAGPFVIPAFQFAGYMQGPGLWKRSEAAMAAGRRRAKARSRVQQRRQPKVRVKKPEI